MSKNARVNRAVTDAGAVAGCLLFFHAILDEPFTRPATRLLTDFHGYRADAAWSDAPCFAAIAFVVYALLVGLRTPA